MLHCKHPANICTLLCHAKKCEVTIALKKGEQIHLLKSQIIIAGYFLHFCCLNLFLLLYNLMIVLF